MPITLWCLYSGIRIAYWATSHNSLWELRVALEADRIHNTQRLLVVKSAEVVVATLGLTLQAYFRWHSYVDRDSTSFWENLEPVLPVNKLGEAELLQHSDQAVLSADDD